MLSGHVIFCDDIRNEVGGKTTYVGCYKGGLHAESSLPFTLPKLCVIIIWTQTLDEQRLPVDVAIFLPGADDPLRAALDMKAPEVGPGDLQLSERQLILEMQVVISPVEIREVGAIRVVATRDGQQLTLRRLDVTGNTTPDAPGARAS